MKRALKLALVALTILGPATYSEAAPQTEELKTIGFVGINDVSGYVAVNSPGDSANCVYRLIGFDATTTKGAIVYASLMSAKNSNRTVNIHYDRVDGRCTLTQVTVF
jgi:hypothetical protein